MAQSKLRAVAFGEALIDQYPDRRVVAGAPLHVAAHLAARGWDARLISRIGRDGDGESILQVLADHGVGDGLVEVDDDLPTGKVTVTFDESGGHRFTIDRPVAWDAIAGPDRLEEHRLFYFGSLAARDPRSAGTLWRLLEASTARLRVFDVNLRPPDVGPEALERGLAGATVMKMNENEFAVVADRLGLAADPGSYFQAAPGLEWLCVTRGSAGAELHHRSGESWAVPGARVGPVDTVGAGDAFTAALADSLARGLSGEDSLWQAQKAATASLMQRGGLPQQA